MNELTLNALTASIEKWEKIANARDSDIDNLDLGADFCPLCQIFNRRDSKCRNLFHSSVCEGCPVYERTKTIYCMKTPFDTIEECLENPDKPNRIQCFYDAADAEVEFLHSLLPK